MNGTTVPDIIGSHCDHRACSAPVRVHVRLTAGELGFCMHHWVAVEDAMVATTTFVSASPVDGVYAVSA